MADGEAVGGMLGDVMSNKHQGFPAPVLAPCPVPSPWRRCPRGWVGSLPVNVARFSAEHRLATKSAKDLSRYLFAKKTEHFRSEKRSAFLTKNDPEEKRKNMKKISVLLNADENGKTKNAHWSFQPRHARRPVNAKQKALP